MHKRWLGPALLIAGSVFAGIAATEVLLRATDFSYYWATYKRPDTERGWGPVPGTEGWQRMEGHAHVRINSDGLRDRERPLEKRPQTVRIAVLGDSFAEAVQVPVANTFWSVMEAELETCPALNNRAVEVINFGASGYSTAQELLTLQHRVEPYAPDIVLLAFFAGNDVAENLNTLDSDPQRPYFVFTADELVLDNSFVQSDAFRFWNSGVGQLSAGLIEHSRLLQAVVRLRDLVRLRQEGRGSAVEPTRGKEPGVDARIYNAPRDDTWRAAWRVTEAIIKEMHHQVLRQGAKFFVVTLTTGAQVHPNPHFRAYLRQTLGVDNLFYADHRLRALGDRGGFPVLNLAPRMQFHATTFGTWLHGFENSGWGIGHWNPAGHRLAGELMAEALCQHKLLGMAGDG